MLLTAITGTAALTVFMLPWAALSVALSATSLSWFFVGDVGPVFVLALVMQRAGLVPTWWQGIPPLAGALWAALAFLVMTIASVLVSTAPDPFSIVLAGVAGAVNAWLWRRLLAAVLTARVRPVRVPAAVLVAVALVIGIAPAGFLGRAAVRDAQQPPSPLPSRHDGNPPQALIFVGGFDSVGDGGSSDSGQQAADRIPFELFSYAGLDEQGRPLPYRAEQTQQSLERSAELLDAQVTAVHSRTGKPVALLGDSEGTLVVRAYLQTRPHPAVVAAILLSPLPNPAVASYPPPGAQHGWGLAAGAQLRAIMAVVRWSSGLQIDTDAPFLRSVLNNPQRYRDQMFCPVPGTRLVAFVPLDAALAGRPGSPIEVPFVLVDSAHGGAYDSNEVQRQIVAFLHGEALPTAGAAVYRILRAAAAAWQAPPLRLALVASGSAEDEPPRCHPGIP
ncbi:esterase/lipase family protein [Micromonospora sp. SL4-19]|uniref:esterase/lipase family protein n=1 Tax=Micromonospora sp. SL4-19 TaxID=3399129 RepID=UPI003A4E6418